MQTIAFRVEDNFKRQLEQLAKRKGINLSALIKLHLFEDMKEELNRVTENGMTVAEELQLLAQAEEGGDGKVFDSVDDFIRDLESEMND